MAVDSDFLSDTLRGRLGEKNPRRVVTEEDHRHAVIGVRFVKHTAEFDFHIKDLPDGRRIPLEDHIFCSVDAATDVRGSRTELRHEDAHGGRSCGDVRQLGHVVGPFGLQFLAGKPLARRPGKRGPREAVGDDGVRAEFADAGEDVVVQAIDHGAHGDYGGDANDDAENGEGGTQRVFLEGIQREQHFAAKLQPTFLAHHRAQARRARAR